MIVSCAYCRLPVAKADNAVARAKREGRRLYCGHECAGMGRRNGLGDEEQRAKKAEYDRQYRAANLERIKAEKKAWYERTRDPEKEREARKARMHLHVAYCRRPEYRAKKREYDKQQRASEYGPFAEAYMLLLDVERELRNQATSYERRVQKGYYTSAQKRKREVQWQALQRLI